MKFIAPISQYGSAVMIAAILWKTGILESLASWMRRKGSIGYDPRIKELMDFKNLQESNHNTDLARLLDSDKEHDETHRQLWAVINSLSKDVQQQGQDIAFIRGRLNGRAK